MEDAAGAVAVVIPAHNAAGTISQALASVAMQTLPPAEVVVADDASSDDTVEVARSWSDRLPLRVVTTEDNGGPSVARDRAIRASSSSLLAMLDADDIWFPDHLETLLEVERRHGGVALARFLRWAPGVALGSARAEATPLPTPARQLEAIYLGNFAWIATVYRRSLYESIGGFRPGLRVGEDWDLYIRMLRQGARIHRAGHPTVLYRRRPGSLSWDDSGIDDRVRVLELAYDEAHDSVERRAVARGLRRLRAERDLVSAYHLALDGRLGQARRSAVRAWPGQRRIVVRAAAMLVAPRFTARRRQVVRSSPLERTRR
jgi:glycosyltransferase involved in cell wall biosynthesis